MLSSTPPVNSATSKFREYTTKLEYIETALNRLEVLAASYKDDTSPIMILFWENITYKRLYLKWISGHIMSSEEMDKLDRGIKLGHELSSEDDELEGIKSSFQENLNQPNAFYNFLKGRKKLYTENKEDNIGKHRYRKITDKSERCQEKGFK